MQRNYFYGLLLVIFCFSPILFNSAEAQPKREMRAVWVATVANIDFPSNQNLSTSEQKQEIITMLERQKSLGMNTIIFQVRPTSDALYQSDIEPWSMWLTGKQGKAPDPFYDPLRFMIRECRKRSMKIHAWINPYRVFNDTANAKNAAPNHVSQKHPDCMLDYGGKRYFDPGLPETWAYVTRVVTDIVKRYDIDAIHMDDYFYPYRIQGVEFPDSTSFRKHPRGYSASEKDDWRRNNVNRIIEMFHDSVRAVDPAVQIGISPFGVWRNKSDDPRGSESQAGQTNYDDLYADVLKWMEEGWIDYVAPQLYWHIGFEPADFAKLIKWWDDNSYGINLYIGHGAYRIGRERYDEWQEEDQITRQLNMTREYENVDGSIFFSEKSFRSNPLDVNDKLKKDFYAEPALVPVVRNIPDQPIETPSHLWLKELPNKKVLDWDQSSNAVYYVVYRFYGDTVGDIEDPKNIYKITDSPDVEPDRRWHLFKKTYTFVVTAVNMKNQESEPSHPITIRIR